MTRSCAPQMPLATSSDYELRHRLGRLPAVYWRFIELPPTDALVLQAHRSSRRRSVRARRILVTLTGAADRAAHSHTHSSPSVLLSKIGPAKQTSDDAACHPRTRYLLAEAERGCHSPHREAGRLELPSNLYHLPAATGAPRQILRCNHCHPRRRGRRQRKQADRHARLLFVKGMSGPPRPGSAAAAAAVSFESRPCWLHVSSHGIQKTGGVQH